MSSSSPTRLNDLNHSAVIDLFAACDLTCKGHLDRNDLARLCCELQDVHSSDDLEPEELFNRLDSNGDGLIDVEDLLRAYDSVEFTLGDASEDRSNYDELWTTWTELLASIDNSSTLQCNDHLFTFWCHLGRVAPTLTSDFEEVLRLLITEISSRDAEHATASVTLQRVSSQHEVHLRVMESEMDQQLHDVENRARREEQEKADKAQRELGKLLSSRETEIEVLQGKLQQTTVQLQEVACQNIHHRSVAAKMKEIQTSVMNQLLETQQKFFLSQLQQHQLRTKLSKELDDRQESESEVVRLRAQVHSLQQLNRELLDANEEILRTQQRIDESSSYVKNGSCWSDVNFHGDMCRILAADEGKTFAQEILEEYGQSLNISTWDGSLATIPDSPGDGCSNELATTSRADSGILLDVDKSVSPVDKLQADCRQQEAGHDIHSVNTLIGDDDIEDGCSAPCYQYGGRKSPEGVMFTSVFDCNDTTSATVMDSHATTTCCSPTPGQLHHSSTPRTTSERVIPRITVSVHDQNCDGSELSQSSTREQGVGGNEASKGATVSQRLYSMPFLGNRELLYKFVLVGDHGVGKTSFLRRLCHNCFIPTADSSRGIDFEIKRLNVSNKLVTVQLWDTAGQEKYRSMAVSYFRKADGILLLYDIMKQHTLESVTKWMSDVKAYCSESVAVMIIANKIELVGNSKTAEPVKRCDGEKIALCHGTLFDETSCATGLNVESAFLELVKLVVHREECDANWQRIYHSLSDKAPARDIEESVRLPGPCDQDERRTEASLTLTQGCC